MFISHQIHEKFFSVDNQFDSYGEQQTLKKKKKRLRTVKERNRLRPERLRSNTQPTALQSNFNSAVRALLLHTR